MQRLERALERGRAPTPPESVIRSGRMTWRPIGPLMGVFILARPYTVGQRRRRSAVALMREIQASGVMSLRGLGCSVTAVNINYRQ
jgi:hypothetical protein